jgi:hypothetical protein
MKRCIPAVSFSYLEKAIHRYTELGKKLGVDFLHLKSLVRLFDSNTTKEQWEDKFLNADMHVYIKEFVAENSFSSLNDQYSSAIIDSAGFLDVISFLDTSRDYFSKNHFLLDERFDFSLFNEVEISYRDFIADNIIFCEGYRLKENPFFNYLPLTPTKGEVMTIRIPSMETFDKIISRGVYILPLGNYLYTVGSTYNRVDFTDKLTEEGQAFLKDKINEILAVEYEIVDSVAGVRPTVKDRKPLIGKHPENNQIGVFNGLGARGVLMGPYFSSGFSKFLINPVTKRDSLSFETIDRFSK